MSQDRWGAVDAYITRLLIPSDEGLGAVLDASRAAGLPPINVSPPHGKLLHLLARAIGARRILEVGTLAGYSTIWLARALPPGGTVITLEIDPRHAEVARANFRHAGLAEVIDLRLGPALETLPTLASHIGDPFDLVFIDADKQNNPAYFTWALTLTRPGSLIVVDNVVRDGAVLDVSSEQPDVQGTRALNALLASEPRVTATIVQTVGSKGYDGFALALVTG